MSLLKNLAHAARSLRKSPVTTTVAAVTLALGTGAATAIFSLIDGVLLRPLPYPASDRLVRVEMTHPRHGTNLGVSLHDFEDWRRQTSSFESLAVRSPRSGNLTGGGSALRVRYSLVSADYFAVLGAAPALGRTFAEGEDLPGEDGVAVVSHAFWQSRLGADPGVVGAAVTLEGRRLEVVGVMPPGFDDPSRAGTELWKPLGMLPDDSGTRGGRWIGAFLRLAPGVDLAAARAEMKAVSERLAAAYPDTNDGWTATLVPLRETVVGDVRPAFLALGAAVGFVLLIVCANVGNLLLARGAARRQEMALRMALGAGRGRLVRQLLTESLLLSLLGGLGGTLLAFAGVRLLPLLAAGQIPRLEGVAVDGRTLGFALALALSTAVLFGLVPALRVSKSEPAEALRGAGRRQGRAHRRGPRHLLVAAEVALALVVLIAAGLLIRSFAGLLRVDPGFDPGHTLSVRVAPPQQIRPDGLTEEEFFARLAAERVRIAGFYRTLLDRLAALPGVRSVGAVNSRPLVGGDAWWTTIAIEGRPAEAGEEWTAGARVVLPGYFRTLGIPLVAGRLLAPEDDERAPRAAVINRAMAEAYWPGADPVGERIAIEGDAEGWATIVGVVGDVHENRLERDPRPLFYWTLAQARWGHFMDWGMHVVLKTEGDPLRLVDAVRAEVGALDASLPLYQVETLAQVVRLDLAERRFQAILLGAFAALALVLSTVGIYGVTAYSVALRTREMGIRLALGAPRARLLALVVRQGMTPAAGGLAVGLLAAAGLTRLLSSLLYGVGATDPATFAIVGLTLGAAALAACIVPARRATRVDPVRSLRCE